MKTIVHFGKEFLPIIRFGCPKCQCVFDADNRDYIYERDPEEVKEKLRAVKRSVIMACDGLNLYLDDSDIEKLRNGKKIIFDNFELGQLTRVMSVAIIYDNEFEIDNRFATYPAPAIKEIQEPKIEVDETLIHRIIEHAMEKRDRSVSIFFGKGGVSINVYPYPEENEEDEEQ